MIGKKFLHGILAVTMGISLIVPTGSMVIRADEVAAAPRDVRVNVDVDLTLNNRHISRTFRMKDDKLFTTSITNKRTDGGETVFIPAAGSEEFIINMTQEKAEVPQGPAGLDRSSWVVEADSRQNASGDSDGPASNLIDGRNESIWHTNYGGGVGPQGMPHWVMFDLQKEENIRAFSYTPRQQGEDTNGNIKDYELYISSTKEGLEDEQNRVAKGSFKYDGVNPVYVNLDQEYKGQYVKLVALSAKNGQQFAAGAEFNLYDTEVEISQGPKNAFKSSDLTFDDYHIENTTDKPGKKVTFAFKPFVYKDIEYTINEVLVMYDNDHFMRKFLEISVPDKDKANAAIDYIDLESLIVNEADQQWTIPTDAGGVVEMDQYKANLGQPFYIQGMFFGCEFPATDTQIEENVGHIRYYTGKSFERLEKDNQLTKDGKYVTWQTVAGAARSTEMDVIQSDFFQYIESIATPTDFRIQYNSWFDNMMLIDDANIEASFKAVEQEMSNTGVRPLDSYVVDDGWNNYNDTRVVDAGRSGTTLNQTGFWEFNSKFPDGLDVSSNLVHNFSSDFGVWVGPRGGYNFYGYLADILTKSGKGSKAGGSVDVADRNYLKHFEDMSNQFQDDYGVNYWKWDGFADRGQFGAFPATNAVPGYANNHMTGGYKNMYHVTDLWEAWIDLFESVRANAEENGIDNLWISLTCYTNPSPWFLQWANSVWLQCTHDRGESGPLGNKADAMLTYREAVYYDFIKNHEFQFPLSNLYNHDPVYGKEGTGIGLNSMSDEQFANYLYAMAGRGTAFWELYYSDSLMNGDKYQINAEFLEWLENSYHILKNAKMFGGNPSNGTVLGGIGASTKFESYGFSAWDNNEGIISLRNPDNKEQTFTFTLDRNLGLPENANDLQRTTIHTFNSSADESEYQTVSYGDEITVTLQPGEVRVWQFSQAEDTVAPKIRNAYANKNNQIVVEYNEKVDGDTFTVENHTVASVRPVADHRSYEITLQEPLQDGETVNVSAENLQDLNGNVAEGSAAVSFYTGGNAIAISDATAAGTIQDASRSISGTNAFTVNAKIETSEKDTLILEQNNAYRMGIDADGKAYFEVQGERAVSKSVVNIGKEIMVTGVKENNGLVKIFVNGELEASVYQPTLAYKHIEKAATITGDVHIMQAMTYDRAIGYKAISDLVDSDIEVNLIPQSQMQASATSFDEKEGMAPEMAIDGNANTYWVSSPDFDNNVDPQYLTLDLGGYYAVEKVTYMTRHDAQGGIACTGNILEYVLETSDDGETWTSAKTGTFVDNGKVQTIMFDEPVKANFIRIGALKAYHWNEASANSIVNVGELNVYGTPTTATNWALQKNVDVKWSKDDSDCTVNSDRPANMATDGIIDTSNYVDFGSDSRAEGAYIQVDLEENILMDEMQLYRYWADARTYKGSVIAVSDTPDFADMKIVYNADADNFFGLGAGTDRTYVESAEGKSITFETPVSGRYIRVYMRGTTSGGNTNHIVELEVYGKKGTSIVDKSALQAIVNEAQTLNESSYTEVSYADLMGIVTNAQKVLDNTSATSADVNANTALVKAAINNLVNVEALRAAITSAQALPEKDYTADSYAALIKAINDAQVVFVNGTTEDVTQAMDAIATAIQQLVPASEKENIEKDILREAIQKALIIRENDLENIAQAVVDQFNTALDSAVSVYENTASTPEEMMDAWFALANAMHYLDFKADKTQLHALIEKAEEINLELYKEEGKAEFVDALVYAKKVSASDTALNDESIAKAYNGLSDAISKLQRLDAVDTTLLQYFIQQAEMAMKDAAYYAEDAAWTHFMEMYQAAKNAITAETQATIDAAASALADAYEDIRLIADEERLGALASFIAEMDALDAAKFNAQDYAKMQETKAFAQRLYANKRFTLEEFTAFEQQQNQAMQIIKRVEEEGNVNTTTPPTTPEDKDEIKEVETPKDSVNQVTRPAGTAKTGDTTNLGIIIGAMVIALGAIAFVVIRKRKTKKSSV